jgi:hypothetical protein
MNLVPAERPGYVNALPRRPNGELDPHNRTRPLNEPEETPEVLRLVGVDVSASRAESVQAPNRGSYGQTMEAAPFVGITA